jgi:hypothetical protein
MRIIAFGHRQRVGKDTAGSFLISHFRGKGIKSCHHMGIFDPVKDIAADIFGWAGMREACYYNNHPEQKDRLLPMLGKTPRQVMLELGYAIIGISDRAVPELALAHQDCDWLIWNGVRRRVEVDYVKKFNGVMIEIERNVPRLENSLKGHPAYSLDTELDDFHDWDFKIDNNGTLRELNDKVCKIADLILKGEA